ncbi:AMP-binding protein [Streptomyces sp. M10(2022)]
MWSSHPAGPGDTSPTGHGGPVRVTALFLTTALFNAVAEAGPAVFAGLRMVAVGGEAAAPDLMQQVAAAVPGTRVLHVYGPTETTTFAARHPVAAGTAGCRPSAGPSTECACTCSTAPSAWCRPASWGVVRERSRRGPRLPGPCRADRHPVRRRSVRRARWPHVPHRRPRALDRARRHRVRRARGRTDQTPRVPHRTRRDRERPAH